MMRYLTAYTNNSVRLQVEDIARKEFKTLVQVANELIIQGIELVTIQDLMVTSREATIRGQMPLKTYIELVDKIPFVSYKQKGKCNEYLGLAIEKALKARPRNAIVDLEYKTLKCSLNSHIDLLKLLYPNCKVDGMEVKVSIGSDQAFLRLKEIISTQPGIKLNTDPTSGTFSIISSEGRVAKFRRNDYEFLLEIKEGSILILADNISENELIALGRDVLDFINRG